MAVVTPSFKGAKPLGGESALAIWSNLAAGDTADGTAIHQDLPDRTVQVAGTFSGATITFEGSLDGVNYASLTTLQGTSINIATAKIVGVAESTMYIRPVVTGGDVNTNLTVLVFSRRSK